MTELRGACWVNDGEEPTSVTYVSLLDYGDLDGWAAATRWEILEGVPHLVGLQLFRQSDETPVGRGQALKKQTGGLASAVRKQAASHGVDLPKSSDVLRTCPTSATFEGGYAPEAQAEARFLTSKMVRMLKLGTIADQVRHDLTHHNPYTATEIDRLKPDPAVRGRKLGNGDLAYLCVAYLMECDRSSKPIVALANESGLSEKTLRSRIDTAVRRGLMARPPENSTRKGGLMTETGLRLAIEHMESEGYDMSGQRRHHGLD